ncbi:MAG: DUF6521 family protein [Carboxylicivirga sp.]|jgi:hypothetical protein|nr:DUF6521 family protein [Carboxylicivirga sp.]MCT4645674.1 DUF6521 family protein [Carboxylicivirga sp.]
MKKSAYLYNNEGLASVAIGYFMKLQGITTLTKALLILPFVFHEPTVRKLKGRSYKRSLEEFIVKNPECIINFNMRFQDFLPITINSISILNDINVIRIVNDSLHFNYENDFSPELSSSIGSRAKNIFKAIDVLNELMKDQDSSSFYLKLKIEL